MNFGPNNLNDICAVTASVLHQEFPDQEWVILPDIQTEKKLVGLLIATCYDSERVVMSTPMVNIFNPSDLGSTKMLLDIVDAIGQQLETLKNPPPPVEAPKSVSTESPLLASAKRKKKAE